MNFSDDYTGQMTKPTVS